MRRALLLGSASMSLDGGISERQGRRGRITTGSAIAPSLEAWLGDTRARGSARWGFNIGGRVVAAAAESWRCRRSSISSSGASRNSIGSTRSIRDRCARMMVEVATQLVAPYRGTPYRIGYFSDNEVGWWGGALFVFYSKKPADNYTKQRWVADAAAALSTTTGGASSPISCRRPASIRGRRCSHAETLTQAAAGRQWHRRGPALDRRRRRALLRRGRARAALRPIPTRCFSATGCRSITTRWRCGRGAPCRRHRHQLQRRQPRRLDRALFLRRAAPALRRQAGADLRMVLRRAREPHRQPQQRPSDDGRDAGRAGARRRRGGARISPPYRRSSGCTGSSSTTTRSAAAATARTIISASSTSATARMRSWSERSAPPIAACPRSTPPRARWRAPSRRRFIVPHAVIDLDARLARRLAEAGGAAAAAEARAGRGRLRRGLSVVERAGPRARHHRPGLLRSRPARL